MDLTRDEVEFARRVSRDEPSRHRALPAAERVTLRRVVVSEWTKLRTVRSTSWSLLAAVVLTIGFGSLACGRDRATTGPAADRANARTSTRSTQPRGLRSRSWRSASSACS